MLAWLLVLPMTAFAQLPSTKLSALFPTGAQVGTSVDVTITSGTDLEDVTNLLFDHPGITSAPKMIEAGGKPVPVPNQFRVTVAANVPLGRYGARTVGFFGVSNQRTFVIGADKEVFETEPNNARELANAAEIGQVVNGRINGAADIDWFKVTGKAGQRFFINCLARRMDSRLDAALELYNTAGKRVDFVRRNVPGHDAMLDVTLAADGEYFVKLYDFTYAGGEDYFYRLSFTTGPYIDFILPAAGTPGSNDTYTVYGRNLPGGQPAGLSSHGKSLEKLAVNIALPSTSDLLDSSLALEPYSAGIDGVPFSLNSPSGPSNAVMVQFSGAVPVLEVEPNDKGSQAQKIAVPGEVDGQFQTKGDVDCFQFEAKAKDSYWIEVIAHRANASIDPVVTLDQVKVNDKGEESLTRISTLDDDTNNPLANLFDIVNDDNVTKFIAPADGVYRITVRERFGNSRQDLSVYRLIVRKESPDFRVVAVASTMNPPGQRQAIPTGINLRKGDHFPVNVIVFRRDGFTGPIDVSAEGLPAGVTCQEISIGTTPPSGQLVFSSAEDAAAWSGTIRIVGKARIEDPATVESLTAAQTAAKTAADAFAAADKAFAKAAEEFGKLNEALAAAKTELEGNPNDEALKKKVADAEAKVTAGTAAHNAAKDARSAAEAKSNEARAALEQAEAAKKAATKDVQHPARYGTIVWGAPQANIPGIARVSSSIELSVMDELSPFQVSTDVHRIEANHNRQVLVPVKVSRRNGFDQPVNLTVVGQPQNAQIENKPIAKEKTEEVYRFFIPANVPVGTYVTYLSAQAQVSYRKNPNKADRLKAEFAAAEQAANAAAEELKAAIASRDAAIKKATDDATNLKRLAEAKQLTDKALADAMTVEKAAVEELKAAGENADLKAAAEKKLNEAQEATKKAIEAQAAAEKARVDGETTAKQSDEAKVAAEAAAKGADEKVKATTNEKTAADQRFKQADAYSKPNNYQFLPPTTPIIFTVKPAPYVLTANPADGGNIKIGGKIEVKCEVKRQNGFAGPVTLTLPLPPNVVGVKAEPVVIPAEQSAGILQVEAAGDAPEAQLANMVVRAVSQWDGEAAVDVPVTLKVVK